MTDQPAVPVDAEDDLPEQIRVRREKRQRLLDSGQDAYPVSVPRTHTIAQVRAAHPDLEPDTATGETVSVAGRVIFVRNTGKLCFATLRAGEGTEIQAMLSLDKVGEERLAAWKADVDLGDHVSVTGEVITSRRGELSILADSWVLAAKTLRPLPVEHKPLAEETRVRQRYVDLIVRPQAREVARLRIRTVASLRESFAARDYVEVETPMLQTMHGGASARPFVTHSNAFDIDLFLRIAPELFLKRCVVGGIDRVFEINRNFRNEGADSTHSPEFAMLEFYEAYADYRDMARTTRELIQEATLAVHGSLVFERIDGETRDFSGEWDEVYVYPSVSEAVGREITPETPVEVLRELVEAVGIKPEKTWVPGKYVEELLEHHVVSTFVRPTFVMDYPEDTSPLVRAHRTQPGVVEKWDLYIDGAEQGTGYSELVDPVIQRDRLVAQSLLKAGGDVEAMQVDEDFLRALEFGMPPSGGVGVGIDRLLMNLTGLNIRETILFPLVKPE
ncbi:MAG: lysine--tRNA ligase [Actinobacteria bacterium]|nr:lysine--tRNA ligase [Actinomycetota bacterium]